MRVITENGVDANVVLNPDGSLPMGPVGSGEGGGGSITIGTVDISQTTPGTSNGVAVNAPLPVGANVIGSVSLKANAAGGYGYSHISTLATTTIKSGAGTLHSISVNTVGAAANTATIYDSLTGTGTVIAVITTLSAQTLLYDLAFATGLTIVTATGTAADLTVTYA